MIRSVFREPFPKEKEGTRRHPLVVVLHRDPPPFFFFFSPPKGTPPLFVLPSLFLAALISRVKSRGAALFAAFGAYSTQKEHDWPW